MFRSLFYLFLAGFSLAGVACKDGMVPVSEATLQADEAVHAASASLDLNAQNVHMVLGDTGGDRYLTLDVPLEKFFPGDVSLKSGTLTFEKVSVRAGGEIVGHVRSAMTAGVELNGDFTVVMDSSGTDKPLMISFSPERGSLGSEILVKGFNFPVSGLEAALGSFSFPLLPVSVYGSEFVLNRSLAEDDFITLKMNGKELGKSSKKFQVDISYLKQLSLPDPVSALVFDPFGNLWLGFANQKMLGVLRAGTDVIKKMELGDLVRSIDVSQKGSRVAVCHETLSKITLLNLLGDLDNSPTQMAIDLPVATRCLGLAFGKKDHLMALIQTHEKEKHILFIDAKKGALESETQVEVPFDRLIRSSGYGRVLGAADKSELSSVWRTTEKGFEWMKRHPDVKNATTACFDKSGEEFFPGSEASPFKAATFSGDSKFVFLLGEEAKIYPLSMATMKMGDPIYLFEKILGAAAVSNDFNYWVVASDKGLLVIDIGSLSDSIQK